MNGAIFSNNTASTGGGYRHLFGSLDDPDVLSLTNVIFSGNQANYGAAISAGYTDFTLRNATFFNNVSTTGGVLGFTATYLSYTYNYDISHVSFYQNSPIAMAIQGAGSVPMTNLVFYGNGGNDIAGSSVVSNSCSEQDLTGWGAGNQTLTANPFDDVASGELFLRRDVPNPCIDNGDDTAADAVYGVDVWKDLTTDSSGAILDTGPVDMGAHYDPLDAWVHTFTVDATNASWTTHAPTGGSCSVIGPGLNPDYDVPDADRADGDLVPIGGHGLSAGDVITIVCANAEGKMSQASEVVP